MRYGKEYEMDIISVLGNVYKNVVLGGSRFVFFYYWDDLFVDSGNM